MLAQCTLKYVLAAAVVMAAPPASAGDLFDWLFSDAATAAIKEKQKEMRSSGKSDRLKPRPRLPEKAPIPTPRPAFFFGLTAMPVIPGEQEAPAGHQAYCERYRDDCQPHQAFLVELDETALGLLTYVNDAVNAEVQAASDEEQYGAPEWWDYPTSGLGDCEDYVLEKRRRLIEAGWPASALLITVVKAALEDGGFAGHSVLTAATDQGDLILDNLKPYVIAWQEAGYEFLARQASYDASRWEGIDDYRYRVFVSTTE